MKVITVEELDEFHAKINSANTIKDITRRKNILEDVYDELERNLIILGATCVEDRL